MSRSFHENLTSLETLQKRNGHLIEPIHGVKRAHDDSVNRYIYSAHDKLKHDAVSALQSSQPPKNRLQASRIVELDESAIASENHLPTSKSALPSRSAPSQHPLLQLSYSRYGLDKQLVSNLASMGIQTIYPWQSSCLLGHGLLDGTKNLVYSAPTGGGKSLVADVLMLRRVVENPTKKAILVLPYVALVQEKLKWLRRLVEGVQKRVPDSSQDPELPAWKRPHTASIRVAGFFGGSKARLAWADVDIAICTIEKANGLINTSIEDASIADLGIVVMDELHMIDDEHRGYLMELMASKILSLESSTQIVGMSATLTNGELVAKWLNARYYDTKYVPVPLDEFLVYDDCIYPISSANAFYRTSSQLNVADYLGGLTATRRIEKSSHPELQKSMKNAVVALAIETAIAGYGALVFCSGRQACQSLARTIGHAMPKDAKTIGDVVARRRDLLSELCALPSGLDDTLAHTIPSGVAFHHAGLTTEERDLVAEAYDNGVLHVIVATCSLAAGINLPARRVILQGARMGRDLIGPAMLRQMRGRAGRKGKDEVGESYLCCQKDDLEDVTVLLEAELPAIQSSLIPEKRGIKRALVEVITTRLATHSSAVQEYVDRTLLHHTLSAHDLDVLITKTLDELVHDGLIDIDSYGNYQASSLSRAIVASYLTPEDGLFLHGELSRTLQAFVMDGEMHIFYIFTPLWNASNVEIKWPVFRTEMENLDASGLRVLNLVGVNPALVNRLANSPRQLPEGTAEEVRVARIYRRFYAALQLRDLCNEMPCHLVARKYDVPRGFIQTLAQVCEGFATGMIQFCDKMGWGMLKAVLEHMSDRLKAGARADLLDLARIPFVKSRTARIFWENGFRSVRMVADARVEELVPVLSIAQPRRRFLEDDDGNDGDQESRLEQKLRLKAEIIVSAAGRIWEREQQAEIEIDI